MQIFNRLVGASMPKCSRKVMSSILEDIIIGAVSGLRSFHSKGHLIAARGAHLINLIKFKHQICQYQVESPVVPSHMGSQFIIC
jgi:hypothetical protein